ncbi:MAG: hypothetical protein A2854_00725 [Parcubacteria group bacterium RIFCSPHIGHO2_01_FULL_56_18]|nr:MAG: hypothetical protein A2854_00725 [Parcubacteria group bacterium RIFCSPHIGHO2_01_FULL_56_18]
MKIIATIQVRMGSGRLPGKTMRMIQGKPLLQYLLDRVGRAKHLSGMVVATPESPENDIIEKFCSSYGVPCFRGAEDDVTGRMVSALESQGADVGVEAYGDSPLLDPKIIDTCIEAYLKGGFDWVGNSRQESFPSGMYVEVFSSRALRNSAERTQDLAFREHGTLFLRRHPALYKLKDIEATGTLLRPDIHLDVDTEEDLAVITAIISHFAPRNDFSIEEIIAFLDEHPEIAAHNKNVHRRWRQYQYN